MEPGSDTRPGGHDREQARHGGPHPQEVHGLFAFAQTQKGVLWQMILHAPQCPSPSPI